MIRREWGGDRVCAEPSRYGGSRILNRPKGQGLGLGQGQILRMELSADSYGAVLPLDPV
jgi:hypothetical protein